MTLASLSFEGQARKPSEKAARPADHLIVVHGLRESNHLVMLSAKSEKFTVSCSICGRPVPLQECKIDDYRRAVHENSYIAVVLHEHARLVSHPLALCLTRTPEIDRRW